MMSRAALAMYMWAVRPPHHPRLAHRPHVHCQRRPAHHRLPQHPRTARICAEHPVLPAVRVKLGTLENGLFCLFCILRLFRDKYGMILASDDYAHEDMEKSRFEQ